MSVLRERTLRILATTSAGPAIQVRAPVALHDGGSRRGRDLQGIARCPEALAASSANQVRLARPRRFGTFHHRRRPPHQDRMPNLRPRQRALCVPRATMARLMLPHRLNRDAFPAATVRGPPPSSQRNVGSRLAPPGSYSAAMGATNCTACPANTLSRNVEAATSEEQACEPALVCSDGQRVVSVAPLVCENCTAGACALIEQQPSLISRRTQAPTLRRPTRLPAPCVRWDGMALSRRPAPWTLVALASARGAHTASRLAQRTSSRRARRVQHPPLETSRALGPLQKAVASSAQSALMAQPQAARLKRQRAARAARAATLRRHRRPPVCPAPQGRCSLKLARARASRVRSGRTR